MKIHVMLIAIAFSIFTSMSGCTTPPQCDFSIPIIGEGSAALYDVDGFIWAPEFGILHSPWKDDNAREEAVPIGTQMEIVVGGMKDSMTANGVLTPSQQVSYWVQAPNEQSIAVGDLYFDDGSIVNMAKPQHNLIGTQSFDQGQVPAIFANSILAHEELAMGWSMSANSTYRPHGNLQNLTWHLSMDKLSSTCTATFSFNIFTPNFMGSDEKITLAFENQNPFPTSVHRVGLLYGGNTTHNTTLTLVDSIVGDGRPMLPYKEPSPNLGREDTVHGFYVDAPGIEPSFATMVERLKLFHPTSLWFLENPDAFVERVVWRAADGSELLATGVWEVTWVSGNEGLYTTYREVNGLPRINSIAVAPTISHYWLSLPKWDRMLAAYEAWGEPPEVIWCEIRSARCSFGSFESTGAPPAHVLSYSQRDAANFHFQEPAIFGSDISKELHRLPEPAPRIFK